MFLGLKSLIAIAKIHNGKEPEDKDFLDKSIATFGYAYDIKQDMFYSTQDAWQRKMGYCRLYDESAAVTGMIVDCEPFYFEYGGKKWLIEIWKGQYDMVTGCEIGIYTSDFKNLNIPIIYKNLFYHCASDEDMLHMNAVLIKNGKVLFERDDTHWWLTGFKLAEFSKPSELIMKVTITLKDEEMCKAFVQALRKTGYLNKQIDIKENTVSFTFNKPHTAQPYTRTWLTDWIIQEKNKYLCDKYNGIARPVDWLTDKLAIVIVQCPEVYKSFKNLIKQKKND
ncbi:DUF4474 domain-containing protein [Clostridium swellfunianum]|uniref:DUF4474 domain-containing protein n=1 Tax=Clostridium swellfunianum TaxID=1367462 RepID=UPI002030CD24|nr:DUF4474 domain-containing protein [Clostridium swellfunianum]MCM0648037.1 DUF4474 domain-containing protein [Clostridium swellfunianum]